MNGHLLHETHKKCKEYWNLMFQTFKDEVAAANGQQKMLTIETYIRFIDSIEKYVPIVLRDHQSKNSSPSSALCTLF